MGGKDERKVLNCFSSAGIDLEAVEAVPVDTASDKEYEQKIMYHKECLYLEDVYSWEEGKPLSAADLKSKFKMKGWGSLASSLREGQPIGVVERAAAQMFIAHHVFP